ncbi:MAG TPA: GntR family transcriptional regulator [Burkholderiaceae bacterium]|jgi:GntR family transcriptional regulator|nr:GntR family transcriptional regulator [Burkholderiaceae bacterium]
MNDAPRPGRADAGRAGAGEAGPTFAPLYRQIRELLVRGLQSGEWKPGEAIPSEVELAARYRVSQGTVRKAIDELAAANLVVRRQGRGTFVASHREVRTQFRFLRLRPDDTAADVADAAQPGVASESGQGMVMTSRVLECRRLRAPSEVARALALRSGEAVVLIRRILEADGRPTVLDEIWLPGSRFRGLSAERVDAWHGPLYALFETEFGTRMIRAAERLKAIAADRARARTLQVAEGSPLLLVERVSRTYADQPVELRRGYCVTDRHHYYNELS